MDAFGADVLIYADVADHPPAAAHRLHEADAVHLAIAVVAGADRFLTINRLVLDVTYPDTLPDPTVG